MFYEYFKLQQAPFNNTPDPKFFFSTPEHLEALAAMIFGVEHRRGFVLVTGEVGSGKTLLARMLLKRLKPEVLTAFVDLSHGTPHELLTTVCRKFDLNIKEQASRAHLLSELERFLVAQNSLGQLGVIVVDEGQNLHPETLEQLRLLGNLETETAKLLQIILLGQPELRQILLRPDMKQLRQRLYCCRHLGPLAAEQTAEYIRHRLRVAGVGSADLFSPQAIALIHQASGGFPRMINHVCDNSLLMAFSDSKTAVDREVVHKVLDHMPAVSHRDASQNGARAGDHEVAGEIEHQVRHSAQRVEGSARELADVRDRDAPPQPASVLPAIAEATGLAERRMRELRGAVEDADARLATLKRTAEEAERQAAWARDVLTALQEAGAGLEEEVRRTQAELDGITTRLRRIGRSQRGLRRALAEGNRCAKRLTQLDGDATARIRHLGETLERAAAEACDALDRRTGGLHARTNELIEALASHQSSAEVLRGSLEEKNALLTDQLGRATHLLGEGQQLYHKLAATRAEAAVELAELAAEVTRGVQTREGLRQMLTQTDRVTDRLYLLEDRAADKIESMERSVVRACSLQRRLKGRMLRALAAGRLLGQTARRLEPGLTANLDRGDQLAAPRDQLSTTGSKHVRELAEAGEWTAELRAGAKQARTLGDRRAVVLKDLLTDAGLRAGPLEAHEQQALEISGRLPEGSSLVGSTATQLEALRAATCSLEERVQKLGRQMEGLLNEPRAITQAADASAHQLRHLLELTRKAMPVLARCILKADEHIKTLAQLRQSSDQGVSTLLQQTKASAETLHRWVVEAERAHQQLSHSVVRSFEQQAAEEERISRLSRTSRSLVPALEAILRRGETQEVA